jgi:hypothetical protein
LNFNSFVLFCLNSPKLILNLMLKKLLVIDRIRAFIKVVKFEALILWMACKHNIPFLVKKKKRLWGF